MEVSPGKWYDSSIFVSPLAPQPSPQVPNTPTTFCGASLARLRSGGRANTEGCVEESTSRLMMGGCGCGRRRCAGRRSGAISRRLRKVERRVDRIVIGTLQMQSSNGSEHAEVSALMMSWTMTTKCLKLGSNIYEGDLHSFDSFRQFGSFGGWCVSPVEAFRNSVQMAGRALAQPLMRSPLRTTKILDVQILLLGSWSSYGNAISLDLSRLL